MTASNVPPTKSWLATYAPYALPPGFLTTITAYTVTMPKGLPWKSERALAMMEHLVGVLKTLTLQIVTENNKILWRILDIGSQHPATFIIQTVHSFYPEAEIVASPYQHQETQPPFRRLVL